MVLLVVLVNKSVEDGHHPQVTKDEDSFFFQRSWVIFWKFYFRKYSVV